MTYNEQTLVSILRSNPSGIGSKLLMSANTLSSAQAFMRDNKLTKVYENHFPDSNLAQWFVE